MKRYAIDAGPVLQPGQKLAARWEAWCGETHWSKTMRRFGELGGLVRDFGGVPQSRSAIPLCFSMHRADGRKFENLHSRLKDIRAAVAALEAEARDQGSLFANADRAAA